MIAFSELVKVCDMYKDEDYEYTTTYYFECRDKDVGRKIIDQLKHYFHGMYTDEYNYPEDFLGFELSVEEDWASQEVRVQIGPMFGDDDSSSVTDWADISDEISDTEIQTLLKMAKKEYGEQ